MATASAVAAAIARLTTAELLALVLPNVGGGAGSDAGSGSGNSGGSGGGNAGVGEQMVRARNAMKASAVDGEGLVMHTDSPVDLRRFFQEELDCPLTLYTARLLHKKIVVAAGGAPPTFVRAVPAVQVASVRGPQKRPAPASLPSSTPSSSSSSSPSSSSPLPPPPPSSSSSSSSLSGGGGANAGASGRDGGGGGGGSGGGTGRGAASAADGGRLPTDRCQLMRRPKHSKWDKDAQQFVTHLSYSKYPQLYCRSGFKSIVKGPGRCGQQTYFFCACNPEVACCKLCFETTHCGRKRMRDAKVPPPEPKTTGEKVS